MTNEKEEGPKVPQSDEYGTPNAQAWDDRGNVRPADARWLGDHNDDLSAEERVEIREKEIADADEKLAERMAEANNPSTEQEEPVVEEPVDPADPNASNPAIGDEPFVQEPSLPEDAYADMSYADLQQTAKAREINAGGTAEEIKARLNQADAETNSGITPPAEQ